MAESGVMMKYSFVDDQNELRSYVQELRDKKKYIIALDTESEHNLHVYGEKLCLIQIFDGTRFLVIDPLKMDEEALRILFESRDILKIMYDASNDLSLLKRIYSMNLVSILDLRPAVEILGYKRRDLHSVICEELGITLNGKRKFQKRNWITRPIPSDAIEYSLNDVKYLFPLKDRIMKKLFEKKLMDRFLLKNLQVQNRIFSENPLDKYAKITGYSNLQTREQDTFRKVFDVRQEYAQMYNLPPFQVFRNKELLSIALNPNKINQLQFSTVFSIDAIKRLKADLKAAISST